ncbi:unnamed protein product [Lymnaea stagnalis]|uniref:Ribosome biogenesis protein NOP53 n=1 Tax=Lymnaea stagnalis TaxID=6523 RepID=A0AAV2I1H3_LYMST
MGKMKRMRQKLHTAAVKSKKDKSTTIKDDEEMMEDTSLMPPPPAPSIGENFFQNVNIPALALLAQKLPDFDASSAVTSKTFKGHNLKKKDKQKIRHEVWMSKVDKLQTVKKKEKERKRKQKTPIVGDLTPIEDALPTLELLMKKSTGETTKRFFIFLHRENQEKPRPIPQEKKRKKQLLEDITLFHKIVQHPLFKENASGTIKEHLKHKLEMEQEEDRLALKKEKNEMLRKM